MGLVETRILFNSSGWMRVTDVQQGSLMEFDGVYISQYLGFIIVSTLGTSFRLR